MLGPSTKSLKLGSLIYIAILSGRRATCIIFLVVIPHFVHLMLFGDCRDHDCAVPSMLHIIVRLCVGVQWARAFIRKRSGIFTYEGTFIAAFDYVDVA